MFDGFEITEGDLEHHDSDMASLLSARGYCVPHPPKKQEGICRISDRGSCYRRADIDKSGLLGSSGRKSFTAPWQGQIEGDEP